MQKNRLILAGLALAIVLAVGAVWAVPYFGDRMAGARDDGLISIAIATDETIERLAIETDDENERSVDARAAANAQTVTTFVGQVLASGSNENNEQPAGENAEGQGEREAAPASTTLPTNVAAAFSQILLLQLDGQLTQGLTNSRRFEVMDTNAVQTALERMTAGERGAARRTLLETVFSRQEGGQRQEIRQRRASNADLASVGRELNVRYFLYVGVEEPVYTVSEEIDEETGERLFVLRAQPTFAYRLFDVRRRTVLLAGVLRFDEPMVSYSEASDLNQYLLNTERSDPNAAQHRQLTHAFESLANMPLMQDLQFQVNRVVAQTVIQRLLEELAPAEIVIAGDQPTMNRGANDGLESGMEMEVFELGEAITEGRGREIGRTRERVGVVRVADLQDTSATLTVVSGGPFERGHRVAVPVTDTMTADSGDPLAGGASGGGPAPALGRDAVMAQRHGRADAILPAIAVDSIRVRTVDGVERTGVNSLTLSAARSVADALQEDPRVIVLPRADIGRLARERRTSMRGLGASSGDARRGISAGEYFLTGEVNIDIVDSTRRVTYEGATRAVGAAQTSLAARATFRVMTMQGQAVAAADAEATRVFRGASDFHSLLGDVADVGVRRLLAELFPMQVAAVDGTRIQVSGGSDSGLAVNARLRAYNIGAPVFDPTTNVMLSPGARTYAGDLIVIDVDRDVSTARYAAQGYTVRPGDILELAPAPRRTASSSAQPNTEPPPPQTAGPTPF